MKVGLGQLLFLLNNLEINPSNIRQSQIGEIQHQGVLDHDGNGSDLVHCSIKIRRVQRGGVSEHVFYNEPSIAIFDELDQTTTF